MRPRVVITLFAFVVAPMVAACEGESEHSESLVDPPLSLQIDLGNGCLDVNSTGVVRKGNKVVGTNGPDVIDCRNNVTGLRIRGKGGVDSIFGGSGDDDIRGGPDCDLIRGNDGDDVIRGGSGDDQIFTCHGGLEGGADDDDIRGGSGVDFILGGFENDFLRGDSGRDTLLGEAGVDTLIGGSGIDSCDAGVDPADSEHPSCET